jgi:lipid-A-disaccharide synthase
MLPVMLDAAAHFTDHRAVVAAAPSVAPGLYRSLLHGHDVQLVTGRTYDLLRHARAALVTSGTATLETALFGVPEVVCYKGSGISFAIARRIVKVPFISLVNLIMEREVVRELIQAEMNVADLTAELRRLLFDEAHRQRMVHDLQELRDRLGGAGASTKAAIALWKTAFGPS